MASSFGWAARQGKQPGLSRQKVTLRVVEKGSFSVLADGEMDARCFSSVFWLSYFVKKITFIGGLQRNNVWKNHNLFLTKKTTISMTRSGDHIPNLPRRGNLVDGLRVYQRQQTTKECSLEGGFYWIFGSLIPQNDCASNLSDVQVKWALISRQGRQEVTLHFRVFVVEWGQVRFWTQKRILPEAILYSKLCGFDI